MKNLFRILLIGMTFNFIFSCSGCKSGGCGYWSTCEKKGETIRLASVLPVTIGEPNSDLLGKAKGEVKNEKNDQIEIFIHKNKELKNEYLLKGKKLNIYAHKDEIFNAEIQVLKVPTESRSIISAGGDYYYVEKNATRSELNPVTDEFLLRKLNSNLKK